MKKTSNSGRGIRLTARCGFSYVGARNERHSSDAERCGAGGKQTRRSGRQRKKRGCEVDGNKKGVQRAQGNGMGKWEKRRRDEKKKRENCPTMATSYRKGGR